MQYCLVGDHRHYKSERHMEDYPTKHIVTPADMALPRGELMASENAMTAKHL